MSIKISEIGDYIKLSMLVINSYPNLNNIISEKDFFNLVNKYSSLKEFEKFLFLDSKFNILNISAIIGLGDKLTPTESIINHCKTLLNKLDMYLSTFPLLKVDHSFRSKLLNIEGFYFLSILSELSLAYKLATGGFKVDFETKFEIIGSKKKKDVDITVSKGNDLKFHIEVYMPVKLMDESGFLDLSKSDLLFRRKVDKKVFDKFNSAELSKLNGKVLLAVNIAFMENLEIERILTQFTTPKNSTNLNLDIPPILYGVIIFKDNFIEDSSFTFCEIILK